MHERVREEIDLLRREYPALEHGEALDWVAIPAFPLPPGRYNKGAIRFAFRIPPGYPSTGPDNFFVDGDLQLRDGGGVAGFNASPNSSTGPCPIPGDWGWFSWHPQAWRSGARPSDGDNLSGFVRGARLCLEGREST
jgi:hypothetical protein